MKHMKNGNRERAINYLRQDIFYLYRNRMDCEQRYSVAIDNDEDIATSEYQGQRNHIRELINILRVVRKNG
jgi:hypothetical protein